jgi:hypothetical protein
VADRIAALVEQYQLRVLAIDMSRVPEVVRRAGFNAREAIERFQAQRDRAGS